MSERAPDPPSSDHHQSIKFFWRSTMSSFPHENPQDNQSASTTSPTIEKNPNTSVTTAKTRYPLEPCPVWGFWKVKPPRNAETMAEYKARKALEKKLYRKRKLSSVPGPRGNKNTFDLAPRKWEWTVSKNQKLQGNANNKQLV